MLVTSNYEVRQSDLNELLVATERPAVLEIRYAQSTAALILRMFFYVFLPFFYSLFLLKNDAGWASREFFVVTLAVVLVLFVVSLHVVTRIDASRRMVLQGYSFFGRFGLGLGEKGIDDGDTVRIRVKTTDGSYRHNPMHSLFVRRRGLRLDVMLADYSCDTADRVEFLEKLGRAIADSALRCESGGDFSGKASFPRPAVAAL